MPLTVYTDTDHPADARRIHRTARDYHLRLSGAGMGGFVWVSDANQDCAFFTTGAGPCQIIIIHKARGVGALGHYAAIQDPQRVFIGVVQMEAAVGGTPLENVLFAAGSGIGGLMAYMSPERGKAWKQQKVYELALKGKAMVAYDPQRQGRILYPSQDPFDCWSGAVYLPGAEEVALYKDMPPLHDLGRGNRQTYNTVKYWQT